MKLCSRIEKDTKLEEKNVRRTVNTPEICAKMITVAEKTMKKTTHLSSKKSVRFPLYKEFNHRKFTLTQ